MQTYTIQCDSTTDLFEWITAEELGGKIAMPSAFKKILPDAIK